MSDEEVKRVEYCQKHQIHFLMELLASKVLAERPENPFNYLRNLLGSVEKVAGKTSTYDPTEIQYTSAQTDGVSGKKESTSDKIPNAMKRITLAVLGLSNAGKTTLISALGGEIITDATPTVGFTPIHFHTEEHDICLFDLGGAANFRGVWPHYYPDVHGLIYVIDSASDDATVNESVALLKEIMSHTHMKDKPVLVFANKKELEMSRLLDVLPVSFMEDLPASTPFRITATCGLEIDDERDEHVEWLIQCISAQYDSLDERVKRDVSAVKEEKRKAREAKLAALRAEM